MTVRLAADRTRRAAVAGMVAGAHALLVGMALLLRSPPGDESPEPLVVTTMFDLPPARAPLPDEPAAVSPPRLQEFTPTPRVAPDIPEIEVVDTAAPETPDVFTAPVAEERPAAGPAGDAGGSAGRGGSGNGLVLLERVLPAYPRAAARRGERGITQVLIHVMPSGRVDQVKVERGSGSKLLDDAAVAAFRKWRFQRLPDAPAGGRWLRTAQRFILYQFTYSRLDADAMEYVYAENLKPKGGAVEEATPGAIDALLRLIGQLRDGTFDSAGAIPAKDLAALRANLVDWGAVQSTTFMGIVGSARWLRHGTRGGAGAAVEVSWNSFEVRHENAISEWLIAMDHNGGIWAAQVARPPE